MLSQRTGPKDIIITWVLDLVNKEEVPPEIKAFNFGIFESLNGYTIYLIGSRSYDREDSDWACNEDFTPRNKYCPLTYPGKAPAALEFLAFAKATIATIIREKGLFDGIEFITIGFDDGDLETIRG